MLLRQQIEASDKVREPVFIEDIAANGRGYQLLYQAERMGGNQGRLKAQFLTNAILHYVEGTATLPPQEELESILERLMKRMLDDRADMSAKPTEKIDSSEPFSADDLATIAGTLQAFRR